MRRTPDSAIHTGLKSLADVASFGTYPKIAGIAETLITRNLNNDLAKKEKFWDTYRRETEAAAADLAQSQAENPVSGFLGGLAGGTLGVGSLAKIPGAAKYLLPSTPTIANSVATSAGLGGLYGLGSSDYEKDNVLGNVAGNAALGAVAGRAGHLVGETASEAAQKIRNIFRSGKLTPEQQHILGLANKFEVPLLQSRISQNPKDSTLEQSLRLGLEGADAYNVIRQAEQNTSNSYRDAAKIAQQQITKGEYVSPGQSLLPGIDKIVKDSDKKYARAQTAYQKASDRIGNLDQSIVRNINQKANNSLKNEVLAPENVSILNNSLRTLENHIKDRGLTVQSLEGYRQGLSSDLRAATGQDKKVYGSLIKSIDESLDELGDKTYQKARKLYKGYITEAKAGHKHEKGRKGIEDILQNAKSRESFDAVDLSDKAFGKTAYSLGGTSERKLRQEVKRRLGADSPEWEGFKLEGLHRIFSPVVNKTGEADFSGPAIEKFRSVLMREKENLKDLITPEQYKDLLDFADLGMYAFRSPKNYQNLSGSATLGSQLYNLAGKLKHVPIIGPSLEAISGKSIKGLNAAKKASDFTNVEKNIKAGNKSITHFNDTALRNVEPVIGLGSLSGFRQKNPDALEQNQGPASTSDMQFDDEDIHPALRGKSREELERMYEDFKRREAE